MLADARECPVKAGRFDDFRIMAGLIARFYVALSKLTFIVFIVILMITAADLVISVKDNAEDLFSAQIMNGPLNLLSW